MGWARLPNLCFQTKRVRHEVASEREADDSDDDQGKERCGSAVEYGDRAECARAQEHAQYEQARSNTDSHGLENYLVPRVSSAAAAPGIGDACEAVLAGTSP